jgi:hypothetical protein
MNSRLRTAAVRLAGPRSRDRAGDAKARCAIGVAWLAIVACASARHAPWRDEVRALSLALQGDDLGDMLRAVHGDGHPLLWYLLLRGAHAIVGVPQVLPAVALLVAAGAIGLLLWKAPFGWPLLALVALSNFGVWEYAVTARNYGISMLVMFAFAAGYERWRHSGWRVGLCLALLANTNVHSAVLAGALGLFWAVDLARSPAAGVRAWRERLIAGAGWCAGVAACAATVFPTFNDSALAVHPARGLWDVLGAAFDPAPQFRALVLDPWQPHAPTFDAAAGLAMSGVMLLCLLGLAARRGAVLAGVAGLVGLSELFCLVYHGEYRHQALWLVFMVTLYWICAGAREPLPVARSSGPVRALAAAGQGAFVLLLALQLPGTGATLAGLAPGAPPWSGSARLGAFVRARPELAEAALLADPDYMLESLAYTLPGHPLWLMREGRFGNAVRFTQSARLRLALDDVLAQARAVRARTGRPVIILVSAPLADVRAAAVVQEGYTWELALDPAQVARFAAATRLVLAAAPAGSDERYDAYLLNAPD